jgi:hypothetical protein
VNGPCFNRQNAFKRKRKGGKGRKRNKEIERRNKQRDIDLKVEERVDRDSQRDRGIEGKRE